MPANVTLPTAADPEGPDGLELGCVHRREADGDFRAARDPRRREVLIASWSQAPGCASGPAPFSCVSSRRQVAKSCVGDVLEGLEFEGVAGRVEQEHRGLLAGLTLEAHVRLDHEFHAGAAHALGERVERLHLQHDTTVRHRHAVAVDVIAV